MRACSCRSMPRCGWSRGTSRKILRSKEAAAMIRSLFLSMQELNKGARRPPSVPPTKVKKLAVIGAGFMGASVGYVSARAGIDVVLIDRDQESADKGKGPRQCRDRRSDQEGPRQGKRPRRHPVAHQRHRRLQRAEGLRSRHRGGVRGSQGQGGNLRQGAAAAEGRMRSSPPTPRRCRSIRWRRNSRTRASSSAFTSSRRSRR